MTSAFQKALLAPVVLKRIDAPEGRRYETPDGVFPSVTTVLSATGDKGFLKEWRSRVGEEEANRISRKSTDIGTQMHSMCEAYILGEEFPAVCTQARRMFANIKKHLDLHVSLVLGVEQSLWSKELQVAGTVDFLCLWNNRLAVVDFKSNHHLYLKREEHIQDYKVQIAMYSHMVKERVGRAPKKGVLLIANQLLADKVEFDPFEKEDEMFRRLEAFHRNSSSSAE